MTDPIPHYLEQVDADRLREHLFHLSADPLPFRKVNHIRPGQTKCSLDEADDFISARLESWGYKITKEAVSVQPFRCDASKPKAQQYSPPLPEDPWYTAYNLYARKAGSDRADEIILLIAHKDSQSWVDSPGAYDNAVGTVSVMEIARILRNYTSRRAIWFVFCNEEHRPWTSITAAENCRQRGDNLIAVLNLDSLGGKPQTEIDAGLKTNVSAYTAPEAKWLADLVTAVNDEYGIGLLQRVVQRVQPGDDDGSFVNAGFANAIINLGSWPYGDPNYHRETDTPDRVDLENVRMSVQASLATVLKIDARD